MGKIYASITCIREWIAQNEDETRVICGMDKSMPHVFLRNFEEFIW